MKIKRDERLSGEFQKEIYSVINTKVRAKNPELSAIISVTAVDVAPDLKNARVYVSVYDANEDRANATFQTIVRNAAYIRHELAQVMRVRTVPELHIVADESIKYGEKIDKILSELDIKDE